MRRSSIAYVLPLCLSPMFGCRGCLDLDDYTLVPPSDAASSGGVGGTGGSAGESCVATELDGTVFVAFTASDSASADCAIPVNAGPGIDVLALDPERGSCVARARILALEGATFETQPRVHHSRDATTAIAGTFQGGLLEFPLQCATGVSIAIRQAASADHSLFAARLRLEGGALCTEWAASASTTGGVAPPRIHAVEISSDGSVAIAGALAGAGAEFLSQVPTPSIGAFFATWSPSGIFRGVRALALGATSDAFYAVREVQSSWIATGAALVEDPACHACTGVTHVTAPANQCTAAPDAGLGGVAGVAGADAGIEDSGAADVSSGGASGMGGVSGGGGTAGTPDAAVMDTLNAFIMTASSSAACNRFESFGSDLFSDDLQIGFGIARRETECGADVAGLAGRDAWRLIGSDPRTLLAAGSDALSDGFIARFAGGSSVGCTSGGFAWSLRLEAPRNVSADRIAASRCSNTTTALAFARDAAGGSLALRRCGSDGTCSTAARSATLAQAASEQVLVLGLSGDGALVWHAAFGPVGADPDALAGTFAGRPHVDLTLDRRDHAYLALETTAPLTSHNLDITDCPELAAGTTAAGTWVIGLSRDGAGDQAACRWARRF